MARCSLHCPTEMLSYSDTSKENEEQVKIAFKRTLPSTLIMLFQYCDTLCLSLIKLYRWKGYRKEWGKKGREEGREKGGASHFLFAHYSFLSLSHSSTPQDVREGCKERKWGWRNQRKAYLYTGIFLLTQASLQSFIGYAQWICPCAVKVWLFKTRIININKAKRPVEKYKMYGLFKLQNYDGCEGGEEFIWA